MEQFRLTPQNMVKEETIPIPAAPSQAADTVEIILAEDVALLEDRLAAYVGAPFCVAVSDAASGIALALEALGVGMADSVLCAALGCAVPVQGITLAGATPVFVDINPNTYNIDPYCIEYALGKLSRMSEKKPRAVVATDLFGAPCHYRELQRICDKHELALIEDLSGAFGARYNGIMAGNFGRFSVASFAPPGPLEELGGGAVFCRDSSDAARLVSLRVSAKQEFLGTRGASLPCIGSADACLIKEQLELCAKQTADRQRVALRYRERLAGRVRIQQPSAGGDSSYSQLVVSLPGAEDRSLIISRLYKANIPCGTPGCGHQTARSEWNRLMLFNTLALSRRLLSLPIHPHLSDHVVDYICECLFRALETPSSREDA